MLRAPDSMTPGDPTQPEDSSSSPAPNSRRVGSPTPPQRAAGWPNVTRLSWLEHLGRLAVLVLLTALGAAVVELGGWWGWPRSILIVVAAGLAGGLLGKLAGVPARFTAFLVLLVAATISCMRWGEAWLGWPGVVIGGLTAYFLCHWMAQVPLSFLGGFLLQKDPVRRDQG